VLDHLIVQSMKEEHEEGEIDDMILHGAKALYEADAEGRSATDIIYNSKNVDELIDRMEREANEEAKAMEEGEEDKVRRLASGEEAMEGQTKVKEGMSFGFAKIWEAGENGLAEVPEEEEGPQGEEKDVEDQTTAWEAVMLNARAAEAKRKADEEEARQQRLRRQNQVHQYQPDGMLSDDSPQTKEIKKAKRKGKGKAANHAADSSDAEFAPGAAGASESEDSNANYSDEAEALVGPDGRPIVIPGSKEMLQWQATKDAQRAAALGHIQTTYIAGASAPVAGPSTFPLPPPNASDHSSRQGRLIETPEQRAERKARRKAEKQAIRDEAERRLLEAERSRHYEQTQSHPGPSTLAIPPSVGSSVNHANYIANGDHQSATVHGRPGVNGAMSNQGIAGPAIRLVDAAIIHDAQQILQWLWAMLERLGFKTDKSRWAEMALPELYAKERMAIYLLLAKVVDTRLSAMGQNIVFLRTETMRKVERLFELKQPAIPDWSSRELEHLPVLPIPEGAGMWKNGGAPNMASASVERPVISQPGPTILPAAQQPNRTTTTAVARPPAAAGAGTSSLEGSATAPVSVPGQMPSAASIPAAGSSSTPPPRAERTRSGELAPTEAVPAALVTQAGPLVIQSTEIIKAGPSRSLVPTPDCPTVPSLVDLTTVRGAILNSDEPDEVVVSGGYRVFFNKMTMSTWCHISAPGDVGRPLPQWICY
jgi:chromodomain-helicase-DNA-binding protein 4